MSSNLLDVKSIFGRAAEIESVSATVPGVATTHRHEDTPSNDRCDTRFTAHKICTGKRRRGAFETDLT